MTSTTAIHAAFVAIGLVLFVIGSAGCALAASVWAMIGWRIVQASWRVRQSRLGRDNTG